MAGTSNFGGKKAPPFGSKRSAVKMPAKHVTPKKWTKSSDDAWDSAHGIKEGSPQDQALDAARGIKDPVARKLALARLAKKRVRSGRR